MQPRDATAFETVSATMSRHHHHHHHHHHLGGCDIQLDKLESHIFKGKSAGSLSWTRLAESTADGLHISARHFSAINSPLQMVFTSQLDTFLS